MQGVAGINDNPVEYGINRVQPLKYNIAAVHVLPGRRAAGFQVVIQSGAVVARIIGSYFFIAGGSIPIQRGSAMGALEQIKDGREYSRIGGIIVWDALQRQ